MFVPVNAQGAGVTCARDAPSLVPAWRRRTIAVLDAAAAVPGGSN